jgi:hypothetical protein
MIMLRVRQTAASSAPMPDARPWRRGQVPQPRSGAPEAQGLMAAITVAAPSQMPSVAKHPSSSTGADTPLAASTTSRIYTSLTDVTRTRGRKSSFITYSCLVTEGAIAPGGGDTVGAVRCPLEKPVACDSREGAVTTITCLNASVLVAGGYENGSETNAKAQPLSACACVSSRYPPPCGFAPSQVQAAIPPQYTGDSVSVHLIDHDLDHRPRPGLGRVVGES